MSCFDKTKAVRFLILLFLLLSCSSPGSWAFNSNNSREVFISEIKIKGLHLCSEREFLYLLGIKRGVSIRTDELSFAVKRAFRKGIFEDIVIEYEAETLIITVKEKRFIWKIEIKGNTVLTDSYIKRGLILKEGEPLRPKILKRAKERLYEYLKNSGYPSSVIEMEVKKGPNPSLVILKITVEEGHPLVIDKIIINGVSKKLKDKLKIRPGEVYNLDKIQKGLANLRRYLKSLGYYNPKVGPPVFSDGVLRIPVSTGEKMVVFFKGNAKVSDSILKKLVMESDFVEINEETVQSFADEILKFYTNRGYLEAQVAPVVQKKEGLVKIVFFINEGERFIVRSIRFINSNLPEKILKEVLNLREGEVYSPKKFETDRNSIIALYRGLGFMDATIEEADVDINSSQRSVDITFKINEGRQYYIGRIAVKGNRIISEKEILSSFGIKEGKIYNEIDLLDGKKRVLRMYRQKGFINISVDIKSDFDGQEVIVTLEIKEATQYSLGKVIVRGNLLTRSEVILREVKLKEGETLNLEILPEISRRLYQTGLFKDVDVKLLDGGDNRKDILISLKEANPGSLELAVGYGEYEEFRAAFDLSYKNLWGMNRIGRIRVELSGVKKKIIVSYTEPYFRGREIVLRSTFSGELREERNIDTGETKYKIRKYSFELLTERELRDNLKGSLKYEYSVVKTFDIRPDIVLSEKDRGYLSISSITPAVLYDTRDNPFNPRKGFLAGASLKLASTYFLGETDFIKLSLFWSYYRTVTERSVLALSLKGGFAQGYRKTVDLPIVERFFLGGRNSVRGFPQDSLGPKGEDGNPTGGNAFLQGNLELRTDVGKGFGIVFFVDTGNVWRRIDDIDMTLRYTAGVGIRYNTPVGPLRIDYGHKLDRKPGESSGEFHFSIGHAF
jgi:outer membrane protein insertion porin family